MSSQHCAPPLTLMGPASVQMSSPRESVQGRRRERHVETLSIGRGPRGACSFSVFCTGCKIKKKKKNGGEKKQRASSQHEGQRCKLSYKESAVDASRRKLCHGPGNRMGSPRNPTSPHCPGSRSFPPVSPFEKRNPALEGHELPKVKGTSRTFYSRPCSASLDELAQLVLGRIEPVQVVGAYTVDPQGAQLLA